jgi:hypothetical protein
MPRPRRRVLPLELHIGDRFADETGEWEVIGRPYTMVGGKTVHVRIQRVGEPTATELRTWGARDRIRPGRTRGNPPTKLDGVELTFWLIVATMFGFVVVDMVQRDGLKSVHGFIGSGVAFALRGLLARKAKRQQDRARQVLQRPIVTIFGKLLVLIGLICLVLSVVAVLVSLRAGGGIPW